jgi:hypothetical protein
LVQLLAPLGIVDICLTAGNVLDMPRIDQQNSQPSGFQNLEDGYPVNPRWRSRTLDVCFVNPVPVHFVLAKV